MTEIAPGVVFEGFGGIRLRAAVYGDAEDPPVLILHNGGRSSRDWRGVARALAEAGRYAIALDLRGHGASDWASDGRYDYEAHRQDVLAVLRALPARPVIVAASLGGGAAMLALGEGEEHLARALVLVDTSLSIDPQAAAEALSVLRSDATQDCDPRALGASARAEIIPRLSDAARALRLPTLVVRGEDSPLVSDQALRQLADCIQGVEVLAIKGAGHYVVADQFDQFNAAVLEFLERRAPRIPATFETGSDPRVLRDALGCFATGINVVTTVDGEGAPIGLTANSFTSVSLDPPLILFSLAKSARSLSIFESAGRFVINVLHIGQQPISARFASPVDDRFAGVDWETWDYGVPVLKGSLASFECSTHAMHEGGDHRIFVGRVNRARFEPPRDPLLYFRGRYRRLHFK